MVLCHRFFLHGSGTTLNQLITHQGLSGVARPNSQIFLGYPSTAQEWSWFSGIAFLAHIQDLGPGEAALNSQVPRGYLVPPSPVEVTFLAVRIWHVRWERLETIAAFGSPSQNWVTKSSDQPNFELSKQISSQRLRCGIENTSDKLPPISIFACLDIAWPTCSPVFQPRSFGPKQCIARDLRLSKLWFAAHRMLCWFASTAQKERLHLHLSFDFCVCFVPLFWLWLWLWNFYSRTKLQKYTETALFYPTEQTCSGLRFILIFFFGWFRLVMHSNCVGILHSGEKNFFSVQLELCGFRIKPQHEHHWNYF